MSPNDHDPFASTEAYYADYRPGYDERAFEYVTTRFELDGARVLDLGCGAGQITVSLAARAAEVVGMDPNRAMVERARTTAATAGQENIEWVVGSDAELRGLDGRFRLTTMGRSFHWMNKERTLESLYGMTESGDGIALFGDDEWFTRGTKSWQDEVYALADEYIEDLPDRTGPIEYDDPWDELVAEFGFRDVETVTFESEREWDVDSVVGYVFSLSYCSPETFGPMKEAFESDLRARLDSGETFMQDAVATVIAGTR